MSRVPAHTVTQPSPQICVRSVRAPLPPPSSVVVAVLFVTSMSAWSRPSSSSVSGDGFWTRALSGLPVALADGLHTAELDDPTALTTHPRMDLEEAVSGLRALSCTMLGGIIPAPSGAASSSHSSASDLRAGIALCSSSWSAASAASGSGDVGGDPRTVQALFVQDTGGDPRTDHEAFVNDKGGDPRTDHASLNDENLLCREMAATCPPCRPGRLATETANSSASASAVLATVDDEHPDGLPCESPVHRDGLPGSASLKREANPESSSLLDRIFQKNTVLVFYGIFTLVKVRRVSASRSSIKFKSCPLL